MRVLSTLLALGLFLVPLSLKADVFNPKSFTLDNGLQVVLIENNRVPVVNHVIWYKVGSADEPIGKSGIAHYFEHLMFKGTKTLAPGEFSKTVALNGGRDNAFTSYDYTGYTQTVAKDRLGIIMKMEADRMKNLTLDKEIIEPERQVILEERRQRVDNDPGAQLREQMNATLFMHYPYRVPIIGWEHEINDLSLEDLNDFYRSWYAPNNAIVVVEGDMTLAELRRLTETYYGPLKRGPDIQRNRPIEPTVHADRRVIKQNDRVQQPSVQRSFIAPSYKYNSGPETDPYALQVLEHILGAGQTSRLYKSLVIDQKIAVSAGMYYSPSAYGPSQAVFWASPAPGYQISDLEKAIEAEIDLLLEKGVSRDEVVRAQTSLVNDAIFARDRLGTGGRIIGMTLAIDLDIDVVERWPDRISRITVQNVNEAMKRVLDDTHSVTGILIGQENQL